jgi:hypothetical protein
MPSRGNHFEQRARPISLVYEVLRETEIPAEGAMDKAMF